MTIHPDILLILVLIFIVILCAAALLEYGIVPLLKAITRVLQWITRLIRRLSS